MPGSADAIANANRLRRDQMRTEPNRDLATHQAINLALS